MKKLGFQTFKWLSAFLFCTSILLPQIAHSQTSFIDWFEGDYTLFSPFYPDHGFGHAISKGGDVDKDGYLEFLVGAPYLDNPALNSPTIPEGGIFLYTGKTKRLMYSLMGRVTSEILGHLVALGDYDGDGADDLIFNSQTFAGKYFEECIEIYSIFKKQTIQRTCENNYILSHTCYFCDLSTGDIDNDQKTDILVHYLDGSYQILSHQQSPYKVDKNNSAYIPGIVDIVNVDGAGPAEIISSVKTKVDFFNFPNGYRYKNPKLHLSIPIAYPYEPGEVSVGEVNGDRVKDFCINVVDTQNWGNAFYLLDGKSLKSLTQITPMPMENVQIVGDLNGDGQAELIGDQFGSADYFDILKYRANFGGVGSLATILKLDRNINGSKVVGIGDWDQDSTSELVLAYPHDHRRNVEYGSVQVVNLTGDYKYDESTNQKLSLNQDIPSALQLLKVSGGTPNAKGYVFLSHYRIKQQLPSMLNGELLIDPFALIWPYDTKGWEFTFNARGEAFVPAYFNYALGYLDLLGLYGAFNMFLQAFEPSTTNPGKFETSNGYYHLVTN